MHRLREAWSNAFYRVTVTYITILVTIIFGLQIYRYYFDLPSEQVKCGAGHPSVITLVPVVGVFFDA